jgi:hypothetical protein
MSSLRSALRSLASSSLRSHHTSVTLRALRHWRECLRSLGARAGMPLSVRPRKTANAVSRLADQLERSVIRDRVAVGIVLQERSGLFDGTGGNEAIGRTADRLASLPQYAVDLRGADEERLPHFQIREVTRRDVANAAELRIVLSDPQDLTQDDPRKADVLRSFDHCPGPVGLRMTDAVQERDPDARVDDDQACRRPRRIDERSPSHLTLPASCRMRCRRRLRTSRRRARSTTSFVKRAPVSSLAVSTRSSSQR